MKHAISTVLLGGAMALGLSSSAAAQSRPVIQPIPTQFQSGMQTVKHQLVAAQAGPEVYVVMFHADWCGPCKVVGPSLTKVLQKMADPQIEHLTFDMTSPSSQEASAYAAFNRHIVEQYNNWHGVTGFAAVIDATTKRSLGCVDIKYSPNDMATHISQLKAAAIADSPIPNLTCPAYNGPR